MNGLDPAAQAILDRLPAAPLAFAVKGVLVFVLAYVVTRFARSLTAERRHAFWLIVLFVLAILPVAQLAAPVVRVPLLDPLPPASGPPPAAVLRPAPLTLDKATPRGAATSSAPAERTGGSGSTWILMALAGAWFVGALAVGIRLATGHLALARVLRSGAVSPGPEALLRELAGKAGVRPVRVFAHPRVTIPFTTGVLRPTIFLPGTWHSWTRSALEAVLFHELAHVKRRDALSNACAQLACAVAWFNPLAWVARGMLFREAELSCDRAVLSRGVSALDYANTIVEIVRRARGVPLRSSWPRLGRRNMVRERITGILNPEPGTSETRLRRGRILALVICLLAPLFLLSVSFRGTDKLFGMWLRPENLVLRHGDPYAQPGIEGEYVGDPARSRDRQAWNEDGTGYMAVGSLPGVPARRCRFVIEERWTDTEGYTWYHIQARWSGAPFPLYTVIRIHPSGNQYELTDSPLGYPARFRGTPGDEKHQVYVRL